jgi:hypothetical protein
MALARLPEPATESEVFISARRLEFDNLLMRKISEEVRESLQHIRFVDGRYAGG